MEIKAPSPVAILLMTYNGMKYLPELLRSLQEQSYDNWTLVVQDDLSTDGTRDYLQEQAGQDKRIIIKPNNRKLGAMRGFMDLLGTVESDFYMFCDQDDVWLPEKIEKTLQLMLETQNWLLNDHPASPLPPIIAHTDLKVVDAELNPICESFWKMERIDPALLRTFNQQAGHNLVTGCTMLINKAARQSALAHDSKLALMHDVWIALCVLKHKGHIVELPQATILYRQHGNNTLGAHDDRKNYLVKRLQSLPKVWKDNVATYKMFQSIGYGCLLKYLYYKLSYPLKYRAD